MADSSEITITQTLAFFAPAQQQGLPVPIDEWHRIMNRIKRCSNSTTSLEAFGWSAIGAAISFVAVVVTFPFSVEWSKVSQAVEHVNWAAVGTEGVCGFLALTFGIAGWLALHWAGIKNELQREMGELLVEDMQELENRHTPRIHNAAATSSA